MMRLVLFTVLWIAFVPPGHDGPPENAGASGTALFTAGSPEGPVPVKTGVLPPGIHQQTLRNRDGMILRFTISVPVDYSKGTLHPLVVALHYGGTVTPFYGRGILERLVAPALAPLNAVIVAPDSISGRWTNTTNEAAVMDIVDRLVTTYEIDTKKLLVTGYSMGGQGAWYLAGRNQDRFSAAIPISARPYDGISWKIPLYVIHSRQDEVIPFDLTRRFVESLHARGADVRLATVEGITHYETSRFLEALRGAIPWIRRVFDSESSITPAGE